MAVFEGVQTPRHLQTLPMATDLIVGPVIPGEHQNPWHGSTRCPSPGQSAWLPEAACKAHTAQLPGQTEVPLWRHDLGSPAAQRGRSRRTLAPFRHPAPSQPAATGHGWGQTRCWQPSSPSSSSPLQTLFPPRAEPHGALKTTGTAPAPGLAGGVTSIHT